MINTGVKGVQGEAIIGIAWVMWMHKSKML